MLKNESIKGCALILREFINPSGTFLKTKDGHMAFLPATLPPEFDFTTLVPLISEAGYLIGMLNGLGKRLRNPHLLIRPQLMKEAVSSSKIEGSRVSLSDLYYHQAGLKEKQNQIIDPEGVSNYVDALEMALRRVLGGADINLNLINECHKMLLRGVRGSEAMRGSLRTRQNWVGRGSSGIKDATYVPPTPEKVPDLMDNLLDFMNGPSRRFTPLLQCAIVHYQFEAIHPYEDGNGRIGRLLIPLMLADRRLLSAPLLYLSGYIEQHREKYYDLLFNVSRSGEWVEWARFFLMAVIHQAQHSIGLVEKLDELREAYLERTNIRRISGTVIKIIDVLFEAPIVTRRTIRDKLGVSDLSATNSINRLVELGILEELRSYGNKKLYGARAVYDLLNDGS